MTSSKERVIGSGRFGPFDAIGNPVVALDRQGRILFLNKAFHKLLGYKTGEINGRDWFETCIPKENRKKIIGVFKKCMTSRIELVEHYDNPVIAKRGEKRLLSWYNTLLKDEKGKVNEVLSSAVDITESKKAEEILRKRSDEFKRFNRLAVGRELRMVELKKRIRELEEKLREK